MRQYVSGPDFMLAPMAAGLGATPGAALDRVLRQASARVDQYCKRKIGAPAATTLSGALGVGATQIPLTSIVGIDGTPETALRIGSGSTLETLQCAGITALGGGPSPAAYTGTVQLYPGVQTQYAHGSGEPVSAVYYEQTNPLTSSTSKMDQYFDFTQQGQIAEAHAPRLGLGENVRTIFLRHMPILQLFAIAIAYPWANVLDTGGVPSDMEVVVAEGWYRMPIGYFNPPDSVVYTTYTAGYLYIPDDVQEAVICEAAAQLAFVANPFGTTQERVGGMSRTFARPAGGASPGSALLYSQRACELLHDYVNPALV